MASACALEWVPDSLYNMAVSAIVTTYSKYRRELKSLPENVQFDIYYKLYNKGRLCQLGMEFSELDTFAKVLKVNDKRHLLHHCFQALMDHGVRVSEILADAFTSQVYQALPDIQSKDKVIQLGFALGGFLSDAGWFSDAEKVYKACLSVCQIDVTVPSMCKSLECSVRLLHVQNSNCKYQEAKATCKDALYVIEKIDEHGTSVNKATLYTEYCALLFAESQYDEAFKHCGLAMKELSLSLPQKAVVDILRQCSKACVVKREFCKAEVLIKYAVSYARECFGCHHPKYADALLDYGFYLLNVDSIAAAVQVYQNALDIRQAVFGGNNLHVAVAHEDLSYASYVQEYSSGRFTDAKDHAEKAIEILEHILPKDHLMLSSSKRVKALILEEIAIDSHNKEVEDKLLTEAQELHLQSLALARKAFGENNVQTAKHYGNLGRLYQSMHNFEEAEQMHLQAIDIKERLLGAEDYEVALSVGHLASLYNYDMDKYDEAEKLYLRSIEIGKKLFGEGYSGLEYDYRGLLRLYRQVGNQNMADQYASILQQWNGIRHRNNAIQVKPLEFELTSTLQDLVTTYF
ncbi:amyloid protein-binding protein 2-like [Ruditapes philippinarum]|uniref:amyloid protein-binding protein 2-like n=1 Tax=Ruditapes philippinarum TaxID=129788 RepID=UPI00295B19A6|nr:amyloid protein-binding protein 2-like [Ruditapes philippinarum]